MNDTKEFTIGAEVTCEEGACGELRRIVVDPVRRVVTHLVVEPKHRQGGGRLVPVDLVELSESGVLLACTLAEFDELDPAEETQFLQGASGPWGYRQEDMLSLPYFGLGMGMGGMGLGGGGFGAGGVEGGIGSDRSAVTYEKLPIGEVAVRRGDHVHATDGRIGRVRGLVIDQHDDHVTHLLLDEGHLWGKKEVAIPISAVTSVDDGVVLTLSKDEVRDLPAVAVDHQG